MNIEIKTDLVKNIVKLKIWYAKWLTYYDVPFELALSRHVDFYQHTSLDQGDWRSRKERRQKDPVWQMIIESLKGHFETFTGHPGIESTEELENECLNYLWPWLEEKLNDETEDEKPSPYGCFNYNQASGKNNVISLHFINAYTPDSPFKHKSKLVNSLQELLIDVQKELPEVKTVQMHSWLTVLPIFAELFPESWLKNARPLGPDSGNGCWGQFVDKTGGFNHRNGAHLRKTGQFPFPYTHCHCPVKELQNHLPN